MAFMGLSFKIFTVFIESKGLWTVFQLELGFGIEIYESYLKRVDHLQSKNYKKMQEQEDFDLPEERSQIFMAVAVATQEITTRYLMYQKEKIQVIQCFSRRYGSSSFTHRPPQYHSANSRCVLSEPPSCLLDRLPEPILHNILSRLSIPQLLMAQKSCVAWRRIVSFCPIFQLLYDEMKSNHQPNWIALSGFHRKLNGFVLLNTNKIDLKYFGSIAQRLATPMAATSWHLQGAADGLMLLAGIEGRLVVVNALTGRFRLLPDARISSHLRLQSCVKKNLGINRRDQSPSISINMVVDSASRTFKVMVLGELKLKKVHALIYSSLTNTWTIKLCSEIDHTLFQLFFHATVDLLRLNTFSYHKLLVSLSTMDGEL